MNPTIPSYISAQGSTEILYVAADQQLDSAFEKFADIEAVVSSSQGIRRTFRELRNEVDRLVNGLLSLGLKQGDPIALWSPISYSSYLTTLAAMKGGFPLLSLNPALQGPEIMYCLNKVKAKAIVTMESFKYQNFYKILDEILPGMKDNGRSESVPSLELVIIDTTEHLPGTVKFDSILNLAEAKRPLIKIDASEVCNIQFTSGTTGKPKGVMLSHANLLNSAMNFGERMGIREGDRICCQVPLFHVFGLIYGIFVGIIYGTTLVLPCPGFKPQITLDTVVKEKCTVIYGTPTMWVDMIKYQKIHKLPIETARIGVTGGSPCSPQLIEDILSYLKLKTINNIYGCTETSGAIFLSKQEESLKDKLNTVGCLADHHQVKIVDFKGNIVPMGVAGELCVKGHGVMLGYFEDEVKTKEVLTIDGWYKTGDQFILREDGYGEIVGRIKEMIIRGGENIYPKEIEDFLNTHTEIVEAHVIGVPDERLGEEVCAFIRLQDGCKLRLEDIQEFCKGRLAYHKIPKHIHFVDELPKTPVGKVQKFKLKEKFLKLNRMCF